MAKKTSNIKYYEAIGRRKSAVSRVRFYILNKEKEIDLKGTVIKKGEIKVNGKNFTEYFPTFVAQKACVEPLELTENKDRFAISVLVKGSGVNSQLDATILGIARALELSDKELRPPLKKAGMLTADARVRERRKVGTGGKARRQKQSPKR